MELLGKSLEDIFQAQQKKFTLKTVAMIGIQMLDESVNSNGKMGGLWFISVNLFTNILIIVSAELLIFTKYHTWIKL